MVMVPDIITREMLQSKDCKIKVVGDISCDMVPGSHS
jgi:hypothetical protein